MLTYRINAIHALTRPESEEDLLLAGLLNLDTPDGLEGGHFLFDYVIDTFKRPNRFFLGAPRIPLPEPETLPNISITDCLKARRSTRKLAETPMDLERLAALLHMSLREFEVNPESILGRRPYASGGGLYPLEAYIIARNIADLPIGVYHYDANQHHLDQVRLMDGVDFNDYFFDSDRFEGMLAHAGAAIVLASSAEKVFYKYGPRAWKLILQDSGHIGQNLYLCAAALPPLGICGLGACAQTRLAELLRLDPTTEMAVYPFILGTRAE